MMRFASSALIMGGGLLYLVVSAAWEGVERWRASHGLPRFDEQLRADDNADGWA